MILIFQLMLAMTVAIAVFWACYALTIPAFVALGVARTRQSRTVPADHIPGIVVVPAHNVPLVSGRRIDSLKACRYLQGNAEIHAVADHCSDQTSERARVAGATVLVLDVEPRGKTCTFAWALEAIAEHSSDPDLCVIVDATVRVDPRFLNALARRARQGDDIMVGHATVDPQKHQWFAQCLDLSLARRNLPNWSRDRLDLSALVEGRVMVYSGRYIQRYSWNLARLDSSRSGSDATEDWRHRVRAVEQGWRVTCADDARVFTPLRETLCTAIREGIRWDQGRVSNAVTFELRLLLQGLRQRNHLKIFAPLDAIQPPVAVMGGFSIAIATLGLAIAGSHLGIILGVFPLMLVGLYALAVVDQCQRARTSPRMILWAPVYVVWRCKAFVLALGFVDRIKTTGQGREAG